MPLTQAQQYIGRYGTSAASIAKAKTLAGGAGIVDITKLAPRSAAAIGGALKLVADQFGTPEQKSLWQQQNPYSTPASITPDLSSGGPAPTTIQSRLQVPLGSGVSSTPLASTLASRQNPRASRRLLGGSSSRTLLGGL